jgi:hypothetical protein
MAIPDDPQQQLEWEARQRPRAAVSAAVAALLIFGGQLARGAAFADAPRAGLLDALDRVRAPGPVGDQPSLQVPAAQYLSDNTASFLIPSIVEGLGFFALAYALTFLAAATRARRSQFPRPALYLPAIGGVLMGTVAIAGAVGRTGDVRSFLDGDRTVEAAEEIGLGGLSLVAQVAFLPAALALAAAYVLVALNAMRAGLLTRFMGILGVIVGGLTVVQLGPFPVVQTVWLVGLAVLLFGRRPGGDLPAWRTGREEPWPTSQQVAEQRRAAKGGDAAPQDHNGKPEEAAAVAAGSAPAGEAKRKRKRRR